MKKLIETGITWEKLNSHPKDQYKFTIEKATIAKETGIITVDIRLNFIVPIDDLKQIRNAIKEQVEGLQDVILQFRYQDVILEEQEIIGLFLPHMIEKIEEEHAALVKTIFTDQFEYEEGRLTVFALGQTSVEQLNKKVARQCSELLLENFAIKADVVFENHLGSYEEVQKQKKEQAQQETETTQGSCIGGKAKKKQDGKKRANATAAGTRLLGKKIRTEPIPLSQVKVDQEQVTVEGILFRKTDRAIKAGRLAISLLITDKKTSLCIKFYCSGEKWEDIDIRLNEGDRIKIQGQPQWDKYDNTTVILAKDIEKSKWELRCDNAAKKRVELHVHTKMSAMDGLNDTKTLVQTAEEWGHKAIAITDHGVVQAFPDAARAGENIKIIYGMEGYLLEDRDCVAEDGTIDFKKHGTSHVILLAKNKAGLKNLYKLVSFSHLNYYHKRPRIPKSILAKHREGLFIGSACESGEVYQAVLKKAPQEEIERLVNFYDYLEIQPLINNQFMIDRGIVKNKEQLMDLNREIVALGKKYKKPVAATCDAHYFDQEDGLYRSILMAGQGYKDVENDKGLYFRTTEEMLEEFSYLGEGIAQEVVIHTPNAIADSIEPMKPVPEGQFLPKIHDSDKLLRQKCEGRAAELYGDPLPPEIRERLDKELNAIIKHGYSAMYRAAELLVEKSMTDGYLVGSRGSVGSSFVATMSGITEVNPLDPHYICPKCKHLQWGDKETYDCGVDMPEQDCPKCGTLYKQEGFSIPFETFLGFEANKEPDIDLNFAGEYQATAHKYVDEIFGAENVFKAGTIGTIKNKTAYGYVMKYYEERGLSIDKFEIDRLTSCCVGVRKTTGQHPGGIVIVPGGHEIYEFCPVQHPANDQSSGIVTTHFDYHSIDQNLLKLDILGHDVPSMIRRLQDMTDVDPLKVPLKDQRVNSIFNGITGLDIKDPNYPFTHGSYGIPEFGTKFVRQMLDDTHPSGFADLVRISGFSHGTDVWLNNARDLIVNKTATIKDVISTRDDIMNYLRQKGLPNKEAFLIMEPVRKGHGLTQEQEERMIEYKVPQWYIESCKKIKYMFPKAHAVAYTMMSYRIAYYKVYHPVEFYAVYFTTKAANFDTKTILRGKTAIRKKIEAITGKGTNATQKEEDELSTLEVANEMYARGYEFAPVAFGISHSLKFTVKDGKVVLPFVVVTGLGENAAQSLVAAYESFPYRTVDDVKERGKVTKPAIEELRAHGVLDGLPESDQLSLF